MIGIQAAANLRHEVAAERDQVGQIARATSIFTITQAGGHGLRSIPPATSASARRVQARN
jgi:hypothetical protein